MLAQVNTVKETSSVTEGSGLDGGRRSRTGDPAGRLKGFSDSQGETSQSVGIFLLGASGKGWARGQWFARRQ